MFRRSLDYLFNWHELLQDAQLALRLLMDARVPLARKAVPLFVIGYILSPFDLIPGFIPILGQMDDLAILLLGIRLFINLAPERVVRELRALIT